MFLFKSASLSVLHMVILVAMLLIVCSQALLHKLWCTPSFPVLCTYGLRLYVPKNVGQNVFILLESSGQQSNLLLSYCNFSQMHQWSEQPASSERFWLLPCEGAGQNSSWWKVLRKTEVLRKEHSEDAGTECLFTWQEMFSAQSQSPVPAGPGLASQTISIPSAYELLLTPLWRQCWQKLMLIINNLALVISILGYFTDT